MECVLLIMIYMFIIAQQFKLGVSKHQNGYGFYISSVFSFKTVISIRH